jgi:hypothetical protein
MPSHRALLVAALACGYASCSAGSCRHAGSSGDPGSGLERAPAATADGRSIAGHPVRLDVEQKLLSWSPVDSPYAHVSRLAWQALETRFPVQENGLETWLGWSRFDPETFEGINWPHNPAGLYAMLADSAVLWYAFSGDRAAVTLVSRALDHQMAHGTTTESWDWASVPYASSNAGDVEYRGADDAWCDLCGRGDGAGVIEPDKVGELGFAYLQFFELTANERYRDAAIACADALARHVRPGNARRSPWPFRVYALSNVVREEYSSNVVGALMLFDELARLYLGDGAAYARARATAFHWLMRFPMSDDAWSGYFEDIEIQADPAANPSQYSALRTARWLLAHRDEDPAWRDHVAHLLAWAARVFGVDTASERGTQWGATVLSEQAVDMAKMGSHTARFGATAALWSEATGDLPARETAARSLNWATYMCGPRGVVAVGEDPHEGWWFSDGYGDYVRHFLAALGAVPEWAPAREDHVLRSTSVVTRVDYSAGRVAWTTFDPDAVETLRMTGRPSSVRAGAVSLARRGDLLEQGYTVAPLAGGGFVVRVRHRTPGEVSVASQAPATSADGPAGAGEENGPGGLTGGGGCARRR